MIVLDMQLPALADWEVFRMDLCVNYQLPNINLDRLLDFISSLEYPRKRKNSYNGTTYFIGSSYSCKFYDKAQEVHQNDLKKVQNLMLRNEIIKLSQGVLRFEITGKKKFLQTWLKKDKLYLSDFDNEKITNKLNQTINTIFYKMDTNKVKKLNTQNQLIENYGATEGIRLYGFLVTLQDFGKKHLTKQGVNIRKIQRDIQKLRTAEISINNMDNDNDFYDLDFSIPSKLLQPMYAA